MSVEELAKKMRKELYDRSMVMVEDPWGRYEIEQWMHDADALHTNILRILDAISLYEAALKYIRDDTGAYFGAVEAYTTAKEALEGTWKPYDEDLEEP